MQLKNLLFVVFLLFHFVVTPQEMIPSDNNFLVYGMSSGLQDRALDIVGDRWNIKVVRVAECLISKQLQDSVSKVNGKLWSQIKAAGGPFTELKFLLQVEQERARIWRAHEIAWKDRTIKKLVRKVRRMEGMSALYLDEQDDNRYYYWSIYSYKSYDEPKASWRATHRIEVDLDKKAVKIVAQDGVK